MISTRLARAAALVSLYHSNPGLREIVIVVEVMALAYGQIGIMDC